MCIEQQLVVLIVVEAGTEKENLQGIAEIASSNALVPCPSSNLINGRDRHCRFKLVSVPHVLLHLDGVGTKRKARYQSYIRYIVGPFHTYTDTSLQYIGLA